MTLFLDLDGVLADFDAHVRALFGRAPREMAVREMWARAARTPDFFETMPMTPDAPELWAYCRAFEPQILTGLPRGKWAAKQKRRWVARHLGPEVPVITCMSREKCLYAAPGDVLVDDSTRNAHLWESRGGVFVRHSSAANTIQRLRALGYRPPRQSASPRPLAEHHPTSRA